MGAHGRDGREGSSDDRGSLGDRWEREGRSGRRKQRRGRRDRPGSRAGARAGPGGCTGGIGGGGGWHGFGRNGTGKGLRSCHPPRRPGEVRGGPIKGVGRQQRVQSTYKVGSDGLVDLACGQNVVDVPAERAGRLFLRAQLGLERGHLPLERLGRLSLGLPPLGQKRICRQRCARSGPHPEHVLENPNLLLQRGHVGCNLRRLPVGFRSGGFGERERAAQGRARLG